MPAGGSVRRSDRWLQVLVYSTSATARFCVFGATCVVDRQPYPTCSAHIDLVPLFPDILRLSVSQHIVIVAHNLTPIKRDG